MQREGHSIAAGTTGENLTVSGLDWGAIEMPGAEPRSAKPILRITKYTTPCEKIAFSFMRERLHRI